LKKKYESQLSADLILKNEIKQKKKIELLEGKIEKTNPIKKG
jgi:hypothetical protein